MAKWEYRYQRQTVLYEALTARVGHRDALLWQSPALAFAAQAFLLTIALGHDSMPVARMIAASLGMVVTYLSIQLMLKHRMYMTNDQIMMVSLEREMNLPGSAIDYDTQYVRYQRDMTEPPLQEFQRKKGMTDKVSVNVWRKGLWFFFYVNLAIGIFALVEFFGFACPELPDITGGTRCYFEL